MSAQLIRLLTIAALLGATCTLSALDEAQIDTLVKTFNPSQNVPLTNTFIDPATDIAKEVKSWAWISFAAFLPFLILPQVLLLYVIFKFRDRKDGRKPATFIHNNKLELAWTLIPCVVLFIIAIPMTALIYKTDLPPEEMHTTDSLTVQITGKQFDWKYRYPDYDVELGLEGTTQLPVVFERDRLTSLHFTSDDVNHAWNVPAFGIKKDCFHGRWTFAWFTPEDDGFYEGQCYELCGAGHGLMLVTAIVVGSDEFDHWISFMQNKLDASGVVEALRASDGVADDTTAAALAATVEEYLADGSSSKRQNALRYWAAYDYYRTVDFLMAQPDGAEEAKSLEAKAKDQRKKLDRVIAAKLAALNDDTAPALAMNAEEN